MAEKTDYHSCVNELYQQSGFSPSLEWLKKQIIIVVSMSYISSRKIDYHSCVNELYQQSGFSPSLDG